MDDKVVTVLRPVPEPHDPACAMGCSAAGAWIAGPCQQQCVKTPEFEAQSTRNAQASRLRFQRKIGVNVLRVVQDEKPANTG